MQTVVRRSNRARRVARLLVALVALAGASPGHAQNEDRPVVTGGKTIGIERKDPDDAMPGADRRGVTPDGKAAVRNTAPVGAAPALVFTIDVRWLGATSYRIERDVTGPIERAVKTLPGVKEVHSSSTGARAQTLVYFSAKEDASTQATAIRNRLDQIKSRLPRDASRPLIGWRREPPI